ncbi:MAG: UDP-glucose 4-epimerase GalE [Prevotellaceae bacterium]|jgi:UDP-glucose 4-epimerase|nr:UDP-glucose 4-epimerase GalE [Prevotellaceae bacterium]
MKEKILVTGGTGYIGSHTVVELQNSGYEAVIVDNLSNSSLDVLDGIASITGVKPAFEKIDCCDLQGLETVVKKYPDIKAIIHFAASKAVGESVDKPLLYYRNNLLSLLNLLDLMNKYNIPNLVFSSSCTVYGQPDTLPVTENMPVKPAQSPYGNTKQIAEEIIQDAARADKRLKSVILRYFNPVGAHPSAAIGELPNGVPNNLIPFVTQTAAGIREYLCVFGNDYNTPDGSAIRDYIYVVDLAKAHIAALERLLANGSRQDVEFFNLGTGKGLSVLEILDEFEKATGVKVKRKIAGRRQGDIEKVWADPALANRELGWKAETATQDMLISAWKWEQKSNIVKR